MPAKLEGEKILKRRVKIYGIEQDVIFTLSAQGIKAQIVKTKISVEQAWPQLIAAMNTPGNSPSYLAGKPYELLQHQAQKRQRRVTESA